MPTALYHTEIPRHLLKDVCLSAAPDSVLLQRGPL